MIEKNIMILGDALMKDYEKWSIPNKSLLKSFQYSVGKKYIKLVFGNSVHAFVDKKTGDIYKPASYNSPAKGVRFNIITDIESIVAICDWAGSWLYKR